MKSCINPGAAGGIEGTSFKESSSFRAGEDSAELDEDVEDLLEGMRLLSAHLLAA